MIGTITTEKACAVTDTPYERVAQYLKRGQLKLECDNAKSRPPIRDWCVVDVIKLRILRALTDFGVSIGRAAEFVNDASLANEKAWDDLGHSRRILRADSPNWYLILSYRSSAGDPAILLVNNVATARSVVFPVSASDGPSAAMVVSLTTFAREIRTKLEAIGT